MVSGGVTVPSVFAREYNFTVYGTNTLAYSERFANALEAAITANTLGYTNLSNGGTIPGYTSSPTPVVTEQEISTSGSYALDPASAGYYTFVSAAGATDITGSGLGDIVLVGNNAPDPTSSGGPAVTYTDEGGNNLVIFANGNNSYDGNGQLGSDTILGGSGADTIMTGAGAAVVYSGAGNTKIVLQDTVTAGATQNTVSTAMSDYNQFAYLDDGQSTVYAQGVADVIVATAPGQVIIGGSAGQTDLVALVPPGADSTVPGAPSAAPLPATVVDGNDTVVANGAQFSVFNATNNNAIFGGSGALTAVFANNIEGSVVAGTGTNLVYANAGDTIDYFAASSTASGGVFVLGSGDESVNAAGASAPLTIVLGTGNETLTSGTNTTFNANNDTAMSATGSFTIADFAGNDVFNFVGYTDAEYQAALASGTTVSGGYQITLSDHTTVTFLGLSSISGHTTNTH